MSDYICAYWLSWTDQNGPLGAAIITIERPRNTYLHAIQRAIELGIEPGGNVDGFALMFEIDAAFVNRLLTPNEAQANNADEIIKHLRANPPRVDSTGNGATAARSPRPFLSAEMTVVTPHDAQTLGVIPFSNSARLLLTIRNAGNGPALSVRVQLAGGRFTGATEEWGPIGASAQQQRPYYAEVEIAGFVVPTSTPETITITYDGDGWTSGKLVLTRAAPQELQWVRTTDAHPEPLA